MSKSTNFLLPAEAEATRARYSYHFVMNRECWLPGVFVFDRETMDGKASEATTRKAAEATRKAIQRAMVTK